MKLAHETFMQIMMFLILVMLVLLAAQNVMESRKPTAAPDTKIYVIEDKTPRMRV